MSYIIILFFLAVLQLSANDGFLASWNGNPVPGKSTNIEMSREFIYIKVHREYSEVFCKFWFYNHGKTEKVKVGFPDASATNYEDPTIPLEKFTSIVNGKPAELKHETEIIFGKDEKTGKVNMSDTAFIKKWYTKDIEFAGSDTTIIEDYYIARNSGFHDLMYMGQVFYFIGTGSSWKGAIGRGDIIFDHSEVFSTLFINQNFVNDNQQLGYVWRNNFTQVVFENLTPLENESISICFLSFFDNWVTSDDDESDQFSKYINYRELKHKDLYGMKEEIKARAGLPGNEVYKNCEWYAKALTSAPGKLNEDETNAVKALDKQLKKFRGAIFPSSIEEPCKTEKIELKKLERWRKEFEITKFIK
jgi:hypothetical protein